MTRVETPTFSGFQKQYLEKFKGETSPATVEELAAVYASLMGVIDVFLSTHRVMIGFDLSSQQRDELRGATEDMTVLIATVGDAIAKLDGRADGKR